MSLSAPGDTTSTVEVSHISAFGIWLLAHDRELFMAYDDFPWFRDKTVASILKVEEQSHGHFHWPDLDIDLTEQMIEHPERFPRKARTS